MTQNCEAESVAGKQNLRGNDSLQDLVTPSVWHAFGYNCVVVAILIKSSIVNTTKNLASERMTHGRRE